MTCRCGSVVHLYDEGGGLTSLVLDMSERLTVEAFGKVYMV